jgi:hypothetical protein
MAAKTAIWIVSDPRPEHVAAITWLNESSSANFYMVKVEAVKIGDSPAAPLFTLIVGPSDEAKEVGQAKKEIAERNIIRKRWWATLIERSSLVNKLRAHCSELRRGRLSYRKLHPVSQLSRRVHRSLPSIWLLPMRLR